MGNKIIRLLHKLLGVAVCVYPYNGTCQLYVYHFFVYDFDSFIEGSKEGVIIYKKTRCIKK